MNSLILVTSIFTIINRIRLPTIRSVDYGRRLVVIRDLYVVKYGPFVFENEGHAAHAFLFLERNLSALCDVPISSGQSCKIFGPLYLAEKRIHYLANSDQSFKISGRFLPLHFMAVLKEDQYPVDTSTPETTILL